MGTHENNFSEQENKVAQSGPMGTFPQEGKPKQTKVKENFGIVKPLDFFHELSRIKNNLLGSFSKLSDTQCINGIVNLSNYNLSTSEISVFSNGLGFCPIPGAPDIDNIIQDLDIFRRRVRLHYPFLNAIRIHQGMTPNQAVPLDISPLNSNHPSIQ